MKQKLYWLDLETTGLSPQHDAVLEMAVAEADLDDPFDIGPISNPVFRFVDQSALNDWARKTHEPSGLLGACAKSTTTLREFEEHLLTVVPEVADKDDRPTLAGRGAHFDLNFLRVHMPKLAARLSYRVYDVSAVALFCESLGMPRLKKGEAHRSREDVLESIEHGRVCAEWLGFNEVKDELLVSEHRIRAKTILPALTRLVEHLGDENPLLSVIVERAR